MIQNNSSTLYEYSSAYEPGTEIENHVFLSRLMLEEVFNRKFEEHYISNALDLKLIRYPFSR